MSDAKPELIIKLYDTGDYVQVKLDHDNIPQHKYNVLMDGLHEAMHVMQRKEQNK